MWLPISPPTLLSLFQKGNFVKNYMWCKTTEICDRARPKKNCKLAEEALTFPHRSLESVFNYCKEMASKVLLLMKNSYPPRKRNKTFL